MTMPIVDINKITDAAPDWLSQQFILKLIKSQAAQWEEISIVCADFPTMCYYNQRYRSIAGATDLLSFAFPPEEGMFGGQIIMYFGAIETYAQKAQLPSDLRWAHLIAHGLAHLQGLDHQTEEQMESMWEAEQYYWSVIIKILPHLKNWVFTKDYSYYYKNILIHKSYPIIG